MSTCSRPVRMRRSSSGAVEAATELPDDEIRDDAVRLVEAIDAALEALDQLGV